MKWLYIIGAIFVFWFGVLIAPITLKGGISTVIVEIPKVLENPFQITWCDNTLKTIVILETIYFCTYFHNSSDNPR